MMERVSFDNVRVTGPGGGLAYPITGRIGKDGKVLYRIFGTDRQVRRLPSQVEPVA